MDEQQAQRLLETERKRVEALINGLRTDQAEDRAAADEAGDWADPAQSLTARVRTTPSPAVSRRASRRSGEHERRLAEGTYGRSVRSEAPDSRRKRLAADPAAELTVEEAAADTGPR